ncbi:MAG: hypothetical protein AABZ08_03315 [Planctomycetota bacterium]|mgnify:CR=1
MSKKKKQSRAVGTHGLDGEAYRKLSKHQRVASFNMTCNLLVRYARVQVDDKAITRRKRAEIIEKRVETLQKVIDRLRNL